MRNRESVNQSRSDEAGHVSPSHKHRMAPHPDSLILNDLSSKYTGSFGVLALIGGNNSLRE